MTPSDREELERCKNDPEYFIKKYVHIKKSDGTTERISMDQNMFPPWFIQNRLRKLGKIKKRSHLKENRYSTIGNLLARERSLKRFGKKHLRCLAKKDPYALAVVAVLEPSLGPFSFHTFWPKERTQVSGSLEKTYGSAALHAIQIGTKATVINKNSSPNKNKLSY